MNNEWTAELEERFTKLRLQELSVGLNEQEQRELDNIQTIVQKVETQSTQAGIRKLEAEQATLETQIETLKAQNQEWLTLSNQQSVLIADAQKWLSEFEQRYTTIQSTFMRLTKEPIKS